MLNPLALAVSGTTALTSDVDLDSGYERFNRRDYKFNKNVDPLDFQWNPRWISSGTKVTEPDGEIFVMLGVLRGALLIWHNKLC